MAPELFEESAATPVSYRYSLGILLYHLVTNEFPVSAPTMGQLKAAHGAGGRRHLRDVRPDLPAAFIQAVERATESRPANRTPTAAALEADLDTVVRSETKGAEGAPRYGRRLVAMTMVLLLGLAVFTWRDSFFGSRVPPPSAEIRSLAVLPFANLSG